MNQVNSKNGVKWYGAGWLALALMLSGCGEPAQDSQSSPAPGADQVSSPEQANGLEQANTPEQDVPESTGQPEAAAEASSNEKADDNQVGGDSDEHGCKASAGYSWCESTQQCERPWELAEKVGFENTAEAFEEYCEAPSEQ